MTNYNKEYMGKNNFWGGNSHLGGFIDEWYEAHKGMTKEEVLIEFEKKYGIGIRPVVWKLK